MRMEIELVSPRLNGEDGPADRLCPQLSMAVFAQSFPSTADQFPQETPFPPKGRSENFGNGPDHLAMVDGFQDFGCHPLDKSRYPFSLA